MISSDTDLESSPDSASSPAFPSQSGRTKGYDKIAVDQFLQRAREAFESSGTDDLNSAGVREAAFPLVRRGYSVPAVDAALGRIEDAFAAREREQALENEGTSAWLEQSRDEAQVILDRLTRPRGARFDRVSWLRYGYRAAEVELVTDKLAAYFASGSPVTAEQVRSVAFRMQRGGYSEAQVDAVLDAVVEVILAVG